MAKFIYKAKKGPKSMVTEGVIEAESQREVIDKLSHLGYFPISIDEEQLFNKEPPSTAGTFLEIMIIFNQKGRPAE